MSQMPVRSSIATPRFLMINWSYHKLPKVERNVVLKTKETAHLVDLAIYRAAVATLNDISDAAIAAGMDKEGAATAEQGQILSGMTRSVSVT